MVYEGGTDVPVMEAFAEGDLRRILRPKDIVVMDNLSSHKDGGVIAAIESAGAIACYLPPYSPDFNPIEAMWSKVKEILRSLKARTAEALLEAIGVALAGRDGQRCRGLVRPLWLLWEHRIVKCSKA